MLNLREDEWTICGRRENCRFDGGILSIRGAFAEHNGTSEENLELTFTARAPLTAPGTEIWASFRRYSRDYHYMAGLRGGAHNHLYLSRLGSGGYDRMLALCPLDFTVMSGVWYTLRIVCAGQKIAVYLGDEDSPRILCTDPDAPFHAGSIALGGGYTEAEYRDVSVTPVNPAVLDGVTACPDYLQLTTPSQAEKEIVRRRNRSLYRPYPVPMLPEGRMERSLEGEWLFIPEGEAKGDPADPLQAWLE